MRINAIACRYHEIAIKGGNRFIFEKKMIDNLYRLLDGTENLKITRSRGRIWIKHDENAYFTEEELSVIKTQLGKAFGLETFSPIIICAPEIDTIRKKAAESSSEIFDKLFKNKDRVSFRARARRSDKAFPFDSRGVEIQIAEEIGKLYGHEKLKIDLEDSADITIGCEVRKEGAFLFYDTFKGPGGLPVGSSSPALALLSGGIDSPVACYLMMKRGCPLDFITFHSSPYTPPESVEKVVRLVNEINKFQTPGRLFSCNLAEIQKQIRDNCSERFRTVLYRRMMFRIAQKIAEKNKLKALVTGEAIGQVASQTIINMGVIDNAADMLVLRPLAGMDKNETIRIAERMGTFEISKEQIPDSCTVFAPKSPATSAPLGIVIREEERLGDYETLLDKIAEQSEIFHT